MFRRLFPFSCNEEPAQNGSPPEWPRLEWSRHGDGCRGARIPSRAGAAAGAHPRRKTVDKSLSFDQIYQAAAVKPPRLAWGILKVADMVNSAHLSGMSPEAKRCSLLMALEAAGAEIEDLLQDAVVRQRALNDYEDARKNALRSSKPASWKRTAESRRNSTG